MLIGRSYGGNPVTSAPSTTMRPLSGISKPAIIRSNVVLPQPEGPSSAWRLPRSTLSDTSSTTAVVPKCLDTPTISSSAIRVYRHSRESGNPRPPVLRKHPGPLLRSEEHTSELQSRRDLVCRLLL